MTQPPGFVHPSFPNHMCKLHKAIYGLRQAPRAWFSHLSQRLLALGFHGSKSDTSLFIQNSSTDLIFFLIYVDDIIVIGNNRNSIARLIQALQADFALKKLGPLHFFLGVQAYTTEAGLYLSQRWYISNLLKKTNMHEAKPVSSPMFSSTVLSKFGGTAFSDPTTYQSVIGSLQYLSLTRLDLAFAVNKVCQYMSILLMITGVLSSIFYAILNTPSITVYFSTVTPPFPYKHSLMLIRLVVQMIVVLQPVTASTLPVI